jgi:hypothetical protein
MMSSYFTNNQIIPLIASAVVLAASVVVFHFDKKRIALLLLFFASIGLGFFIANLDHFLMLWDEQYHSLVAKNMLDNPFKPLLYANPLLDYDYKNWSTNHIWLHKQPLFLWQMAISLKLFGINELAVRVPSIVMHAIVTLMIYRIGKLVHSATVGFYGALFFTVAYYPLELIAGKYATDHNDVAFLFYVTASFWAWCEYQHSQKSYWIILIGLFSGCAVLVKWLVGLLIYAIWFLSLVLNKNWLKIRAYFPLIISFVISCFIFIPWQVYTLHKYPIEAAYEIHYNSEHFFKAVEKHGGNVWFHFNALKDLYPSGDAVLFILALGIFLLVKNSTTQIYRVAIISSIIIVYAFYSMAATKMTSFCIIVSPFVFLGFGAFVDLIINFLKTKIKFKLFGIIFPSIAIIVISFLFLDLNKIENYHTNRDPNDNNDRVKDEREMVFIKKLKDALNNEKFVVFNANDRVNGEIPVMFYTNYIAYNFIPSQLQIETCRKKFYKIAVGDSGQLPDFIMKDSAIVKVKL